MLLHIAGGHSVQFNISGFAFKVIYKVSVTNYKSRFEVYNNEFYISITNPTIRFASELILDLNVFGSKLR